MDAVTCCTFTAISFRRDDADPSHSADSGWDQGQHEVHASAQSLSITSSVSSRVIFRPLYIWRWRLLS